MNAASGPLTLFYKLALILLALMLAGCAGPDFNATGYPFQYDAEQLAAEKKKVLLAPVNFGYPSKTYLQQYESKVDTFVAERLKQHGFNLVDDKPFDQAWTAATRKYGNPYNALTAQINRTTFQRVMYDTISTLRRDNVADAVVFTDQNKTNDPKRKGNAGKHIYQETLLKFGRFTTHFSLFVELRCDCASKYMQPSSMKGNIYPLYLIS